MPVSPFRPIPGKTSAEAVAAAAQAAALNVPILGQPVQVHHVQFMVTLSCLCTTPNPVLVFDGRRPAACPKCLAVYAVVELGGEALADLSPHGELLKMRVMVARVGTATSAPGA